MKKLKVTYGELLNLDLELSEILGIIKNMELKIYLIELTQKVTQALEPFNTIKKEFLENEENRTLSEDGQRFSIIDWNALPPLEDGDISRDGKENPADAWYKLVSKEVEITFTPVPSSLFAKVESDSLYPTLNKFIKIG